MALGGSANMAEGLGPEEGTTAGELVAAASSFSTTGAAEKAGRRSVFFVEAAPLLLLLPLLPVLGTKACVPTEVRARMTNKNKEKDLMISAGSAPAVCKRGYACYP